ncbi:hypothetical protein NEOLEDRAFT_1139342 [Neolentinus lepideus HHB14362 ss-1]|uniref:Uncharacterized protein n=1 Tax=Neolentinus lepideus HHB14362 ss-1 TaxID=1314782 RepID=A0A165PTN9_9AGAM|nr:hypothetical protein NEOLEDRAFT_1139342 [Neolentinus lepideus HHB14362 ss-1]
MKHNIWIKVQEHHHENTQIIPTNLCRLNGMTLMMRNDLVRSWYALPQTSKVP